MSFVRGEKYLETINYNHFKSKYMKAEKKGLYKVNIKYNHIFKY